jgi:hypothetical protein
MRAVEGRYLLLLLCYKTPGRPPWRGLQAAGLDSFRPLSSSARGIESSPKFYLLEMHHPSGVLPIGHIRNYSIGDVLARCK